MSTPDTQACVLDGMLTIHHAAERREQLLGALAAGADTLDLHAVTDFDTAGLQLLLAADHSLQRQGRRLQLQRVPPAVADVLQRCGLHPWQA